MAPAAENNIMLSPQRNVTFAVNYEVSLVDRFWQQNNANSRLGKKSNSSVVAPVVTSTDVNPIQNDAGATRVTTRSSNGVTTDNNPTSTPRTRKATFNALSDEDSSGSCKENNKKTVTIKSPTQRRSTREMKKKQTPLEKARVRYDMELVPAVKRNRAFLESFPLWTTPSTKREDNMKALLFQQQAIIKKQQKQLQTAAKKLQQQTALKQCSEVKQEPLVLVDQKQNKKATKVSDQQSVLPLTEDQQLTSLVDTSSDTENMDIQLLKDADDMSPELVPDEEDMLPFGEDSSVVWVPKKRSEWEDSVLEMTAVCTSAAMRRYRATRGRSNSCKPFHAPLSKEYIRDRVDIDDPLNGFQIRHKTGGWLQGFILWTNFTTWTHFFKWDSSHAMSGIPTMNSGANSALVDSDGSLAGDLESQPRSGNPFEGGVVFDMVAEISLVGGLGCGEYLLRMALESILSKRKYKFVVLQATDTSKTFYERFGFVRVGAICRYERKDKDASKPGARPDTPIMGYRHWTHPNESDTSLQKHGGPSYMMCLRLPEVGEEDIIMTPFLDAMMTLEVEHKPTIEQLGGSATPYPKPKNAVTTNTPQDLQTGRNVPRRKLGRSRRGSHVTPSPEPSTPALAQSFASTKTPPVLPILRGSTTSNNNPSRNIVCGPSPVQEKITLRSSGLKRTIEGGGDSNASTKKRCLAGSVDGKPGKEDAQADRQTSAKVKAQPRRTPRNLSTQTAAPVATADITSNASQPSIPPAKEAAKTKEQPKKKPSTKRSTSRRTPPAPAPTPAPTPSTTTSTASAPPEKTADPNRLGPTKQKVKSYPRDRVHYYNKVVRPKKGKKSENYFVLHYDEGKGTIRIIPMEPRGVLSGKRAGRPRFQAVMTNYERDVKTVSCSDYDIVKAFMVMKTPVVASEAWDVLDA